MIIPVHNSPSLLRVCLERLRRSTFRCYEIIAVDDGSTDHTAEVAAEYGVQVVCLERNCGPATARNRGAEVARGEYLLFIDADVGVHPETLSEVVESLAGDPTIAAVFGSYDSEPGASNFLSQYRNLFHHFVHQEGRAEASTFWAGCGAIRRSVFAAIGGFDPRFTRPSIEDIEMGTRLRKAGCRILLSKQIQVTHLKRWTFWGILKADVRDRGIPWTRLILAERSIPNDLNLKISQRVSIILAYVLLALLLLGAWYFHGLLLLPILCLLGILMADYWSRDRELPTTSTALVTLMLWGAAAAVSFYFKMWVLLGGALLLGIVLFNLRLYVFFANRRHPLFAVLVIPMHVLYFTYCGVAFGLGLLIYLWETKLHARSSPGRCPLIRSGLKGMG